MNLENLGLVELNAQEIHETEGGILPLVIIIGIDIFLFSTMASVAYNN